MNGNNPNRKRKKKNAPTILPQVPSAPQELPMGGQSDNILASAESECSLWVSDSELEHDCRHDRTDSDADGRGSERSSGLDDGCNGLDVRDMGDNPGSGCHVNDHGLEPLDSGRQELADLATLESPREHIGRTSSDKDRHEGSTEVQEGRGTELLHRKQRIEYGSSGMDSEGTDALSGMTTEDCIHAMKLLARFMDVCNAISDMPNSTAAEVLECMDAFSLQADEIVTYYYQTIDTVR